MNRYALLILLFFPPTVNAQTVLSNVREALSMARRSNPDVVIARQNRAMQDQQRAVSRAVLRPSARLFTNFDYNYALPVQLVPAELLGGRPGEFRSLRFGLPFFLTAGAEVTAPIVNRPARADRGIAGQNLRIIDDQTLVLQDEISTQTARVYHAALLTRSAIAIVRRNGLAADTLAQIARQRLDKGLIEPLEYNRIRSVQLTTTDVLYQNELAYVRNLNQLKLLLGLAPADSLILSEELSIRPDAPALPTVTVSPDERPQVTLRQMRVTLSRLQLQLAESELAYERNRQQIDTDDVQNTYNQAVRSLDLNRQNYELSDQNVQIALIKYRSGLFAYDQYLNVFNEVLTAQNRFLINLSNVFINQTILQIRSGH